MKSYLEARQRADLRRDIAARLLPTEGPYSPSDRVYYWQVDKSKIKHGVTSGRWYKARVLSQEGAICVIDTGTTVLRVNRSKVRKENECSLQQILFLVIDLISSLILQTQDSQCPRFTGQDPGTLLWTYLNSQTD